MPPIKQIWQAGTLLLTVTASVTLLAKTTTQPVRPSTPPPKVEFTEADRLRGTYGPYRANNDLLYYHLDVRVDPEKQFLAGKNSIRFKMITAGRRIQLDLVPTFQINKIVLDRANSPPLPLRYQRAAGRTVYVDFSKTLRKGETYTIE